MFANTFSNGKYVSEKKKIVLYLAYPEKHPLKTYSEGDTIMHSAGKTALIFLSAIFLAFTGPSGTAQAKSLYAITRHLDITVTAYDIQGEQIQYQTNAVNLPGHGGVVGLALDPDSEILFVTYEGSNIIEMINAKTMVTEETPATIPGEGISLSGITFDQSKQKLYVVNRSTNNLFVYLWNPVTKSLIPDGDNPKILADLITPGAYGITLDESNHRLFVTNATNTVRLYDTNDPNSTWTCKGTINIIVNGNSRDAVGIALDSNRHYLYTGTFTGSSGDHTYLVRTNIADINNPSFTEYNVGAYVIGTAADEDTGLVYITTKNEDIEVYDTATFPSAPCYTDSNDIYQPADIIVRGDVSYKAPIFYLEKVDVNEPNYVSFDDYITYRITYGPNSYDHNNLVITDYLPVETDYVSSLPNGNYNNVLRTVTWNIGYLDANDPNESVTLIVKVDGCAESDSNIVNYCEVESNIAYNNAECVTYLSSASYPIPTCGEFSDLLCTGDFNLTWCPGHFAANSDGHEVYFGTDFSEVNEADNSWPLGEVYKGTVTNPFFTIEANQIELGTTYYWRIDEVNDANLWKGIVWSFTTDCYLVDNFNREYTESSSIPPYRLKDTWKDYYTQPSGQKTRSQLTDVADPNHDGPQAMQYDYLNDMSPFYAEARATIGDAAKQLNIDPDWLSLGAKVLSLWFYGTAANDANEKMYIKLVDGDNPSHTARVEYGNYSDMNDIREEEWHQWNIALQDFEVNNPGINLSDVAEITIGFGENDGIDPGSPPTGRGTVYFDSIRLYLLTCFAGSYPVGDFKPDCVVNFYDFAIFALAWLTESGEPNYNPACNITVAGGDDIIDECDLARFCDYWLWQEIGKTWMTFGFGEFLYIPPPQQPETESQLLSVSEPQPESHRRITEEDIQRSVDWLEQAWLTDEQIRNRYTEAYWLEFIESVRQTPTE
jgi:hypothetical protein